MDRSPVADLPFDYPSPANPGAAPPRRCRRHWWVCIRDVDVNTGGFLPDWWRCARCGAIRDEGKARTGRNNAKRGKRIQRERIVGLGGQNLPGNKPGHDGIGLAFSYESKSGGFFSERVWRVLQAIPRLGDQSAVLIVTDTPGPGRRARSYVVVEYDEWRALHGEDVT
jgi:hypothetical protein